MSDVRDIPAVLESAAQAAASGDLSAADALLHEVLRLQEASLGPGHPDLASTLNNLAVVSEMANKPIDAETFYRRAYATASASLDPGDPRVATSLDNLRAFCEANGVAFDPAARLEAEPVVAAPAEPPPASPPTTPIAPEAAPTARATGPAAAGIREPVTPRATPRAAPRAPTRQARSSRTAIVAALAAVALVAAFAVFWSSGQADRREASDEPAAAPVASSAASASESASRSAPAPSPATAAPPEAAPRAVTPTPRAPAPVDPPAEAAAARPAPERATGIRVIDARVCGSLSTEGAEWRCVAPSNPAAPGRLYFYTRVAASADGRVRHRWYRGDSLVQDVGLTVRANPTAGYRTYSRQTVDAAGAGAWRVELRSPDGALLREERIVVR